MNIELYIEGKLSKLWQLDYQPGPFPLSELDIKTKELIINQAILDCERDAIILTWGREYHFELVFKSKVNPVEIEDKEYQEFLLEVSLNKQKELKSETLVTK